MRHTILTIIAFIGLASCQSKQETIELMSTIDSTLQVKVTSILENKLSELNALSGQTIIMEVQTGHRRVPESYCTPCPERIGRA